MHLIDGRALADRLTEQLRQSLDQTSSHPTLSILLVGNDPASDLYVRLKQKAAADVGIRVVLERREATTPDHELIDLIEDWNKDSMIDSILVQFPLPPNHDEDRVMAAVDPKKDVDGFHPKNVESLLQGQLTIVPPVHRGILRLLNETPHKINGSFVVLIVNGDLFARPLQRLLETAGASVTVMQPDDLNKTTLSEADVVIIAVGRPNFLHASMVKADAVIIDVGTTKIADKTRGDVDLNSFEKTDAWITPVPGGVGPMTIIELLNNVTAAHLSNPSIAPTA